MTRDTDMSAPSPLSAGPGARRLTDEIVRHAARESMSLLAPEADAEVAHTLQGVRTAVAMDILEQFEEERRRQVLAALPAELGRQWAFNLTFDADAVGRLMEPPRAVFTPDRTVAETVAELRELTKTIFVTYIFVVDGQQRLIGVITFRDLLFADQARPLGEIMLKDLFTLRPDMPLQDAWKAVVNRHFPVYPVCDAEGRLVGVVRGSALFEEQAVEISAQVGRMVGVAEEERLATTWPRSLKFRHPWLQLNLLTAFLAAAVVGAFQGTIDRLVILAMFLPVLAGQSGNTGCQALAVTLRGMTLGELRSGKERALVMKEGLLGLLNGSLVGISAGLGMYVVARGQSNPEALTLAVVVWAAMIGSCVISGLSGALIPLALRKAGADPATASSIFLTTATDVASMGMLLGLATVFVR
jgi:magnesium transporter